MSVLRQLASFVTQASVAALPDPERAAQRLHVADTVIAAVAGARTSEGRALRRVLPRAAAADMAGMMAAVTRHTEIDDIHLRSCTTPSSVTVPTALTLAQAADAFDPDEVAAAIWAGTELMTRLGTAIDGPRVLYRGLWPTYFTAPFAAAAVAARIWRLSEEQTAHALSLALMLGAGRAGRFQGTIPGRSVLLSLAVSAGVRAAAAAGDGVGGDPDLLDGPWLRDAQGIAADTGALTDLLGTTGVYAQLSLKPFCSAKQAVAAVEALGAILDAGIDADSVTRVHVRVPPAYVRMIATKPDAASRSSTIISAPLQMALAAYQRDRLYDIERADVMTDERVLAFANKVEVAGDDTLLAHFPAAWPADVEVAVADSIVRQGVTAALGDPERPLTLEQLTHKAMQVFVHLGEAGESGTAAALVGIGVDGLEDKPACKRLAKTLWDACTQQQ